MSKETKHPLSRRMDFGKKNFIMSHILALQELSPGRQGGMKFFKPTGFAAHFSQFVAWQKDGNTYSLPFFAVA
ncbi:MAG: hypothetical protein PHV34_12265 [Verrucomicrobiae bacterium]|nr:hypothetical protein [Verrucomicrobiae bacterium]